MCSITWIKHKGLRGLNYSPDGINCRSMKEEMLDFGKSDFYGGHTKLESNSLCQGQKIKVQSIARYKIVKTCEK